MNEGGGRGGGRKEAGKEGWRLVVPTPVGREGGEKEWGEEEEEEEKKKEEGERRASFLVVP